MQYLKVKPSSDVGPKKTIKRYGEYSSLSYRQETLDSLQSQLKNNEPVLSLKGFLKLTKTEMHFSEVYLLRDLQTEKKVKEDLNQTIPFNKIMERYQQYDGSINIESWPQHYAVRVLSGTGPFVCGKNIFAFFPEALDLHAKNEDEVFGLEFIDVWENIFRNTVFPCMKKVFDFSTQLKIFNHLSLNLEKTIYLSAVFHEIGHRCGPWKVSPKSDPLIKITSHHWDVMGELATDSILVTHLKEFPEIAYFVTMQRLFWFGRRGFRENPLGGFINSDNDAWIGSYLWNQLRAENALDKASDNTWKLNIDTLLTVYKNITQDIDNLAETVKKSINQDEIISQWKKERVNYSHELGFIIPSEFREVLELCFEVPEQPHFSFPFELTQFSKQYDGFVVE